MTSLNSLRVKTTHPSIMPLKQWLFFLQRKSMAHVTEKYTMPMKMGDRSYLVSAVAFELTIVSLL